MLMTKGPILASLRSLIPDFSPNEPGARTIEYGLLAVGIVVAFITAAAALGGGLDASSEAAAYGRTNAIYPSLAAPLHINDRSTSVRQDRDSVGVGR
jgi:Flp pilus assembly pilin Flp